MDKPGLHDKEQDPHVAMTITDSGPQEVHRTRRPLTRREVKRKQPKDPVLVQTQVNRRAKPTMTVYRNSSCTDADISSVITFPAGRDMTKGCTDVKGRDSIPKNSSAFSDDYDFQVKLMCVDGSARMMLYKDHDSLDEPVLSPGYSGCLEASSRFVLSAEDAKQATSSAECQAAETVSGINDEDEGKSVWVKFENVDAMEFPPCFTSAIEGSMQVPVSTYLLLLVYAYPYPILGAGCVLLLGTLYCLWRCCCRRKRDSLEGLGEPAGPGYMYQGHGYGQALMPGQYGPFTGQQAPGYGKGYGKPFA